MAADGLGIVQNLWGNSHGIGVFLPKLRNSWGALLIARLHPGSYEAILAESQAYLPRVPFVTQLYTPFW